MGSPSVIVTLLPVLLIRAIGVGATFMLGLIIARQFGVQGTGVFYVFMSCVSAAALLAKQGIDLGLSKWIARGHSAGGIRPILLWALRRCAVGLVLTVVLVNIGHDFLFSGLFQSVRSEVVAAVLSVAVIPAVALSIACGALRGARQPTQATLLDSVVLPVMAIVFLWLLLKSSNGGVLVPTISYYLAASLAAFGGIACLARIVANSNSGRVNLIDIDLDRDSVSFFGVTVLSYFIAWTPTFFLAAMLSESDVGGYNLCWRIVLLASLVMSVGNQISAPHLSRFHHENETYGLQKYVRKISAIYLGVGLVTTSVLVYFRSSLLFLFGSEFEVFAPVLMVLAVGQLISMACGPIGYVLTMTGYAWWQTIIQVIAVTLMFLLLPLFINAYGVVGAAVAGTIAISFSNLVSVSLVVRKLGIQTIAVLPSVKHEKAL